MTTQAVVGATHIVEGVHQSVWGTFGIAGGDEPGRTGGLTGLVYKSIRTVTQLLGAGAERLFVRLEGALSGSSAETTPTPQREAVIAALNGVMGDRLAASHSPLALSMGLSYRGRMLDWQTPLLLPEATGKILLLIHGLCMNDVHWQTTRGKVGASPANASDHAGTLATALGYTPVYLRYNSGRHISENARELGVLLQQMVDLWSPTVDEIAVLAHSMGGLLIRSAVHQARVRGQSWPERVKAIVFLGTPHHGAPLERAGNRVDVILGSTPYTAPFARLGHLRSAGITDLRYGYLLDADWHGHDRFRHRSDCRQHLPLPDGIACYAVAASTAAKHSPLADRLIGDGLVPVHSALGQHADARRCLAFAKTSQFIAYRTNHIGLLGSAEVTSKLLRWLASPPSEAPVTAAKHS